MRENIVTHYLPLRYGENNTPREKGIDVWLALEAYELTLYKHFDILVLVAGDGDYVPLVRKLHTLGTQVMLISWDFTFHNESGETVETKTSRQLLEDVFYAVPMHQRIGQNDSGYIKNLFVPEKNSDRTLPLFDQKNKPVFISAEEKEYISTIFSININGFGFIKDEERNNIFFHYSSVTNKDFSELQTGMQVKYFLEDDEERSKKEEMPRYRACKVTVIE
jgi:cold shock CspA family protein